MTKNDLATKVGLKHGMTAKEMSTIIDDITHEIIEGLTNGNATYLRGFGSFTLKNRKQKVGRNISQNTSLIIPEHAIPHFKPCEEFKQKVYSFGTLKGHVKTHTNAY